MSRWIFAASCVLALSGAGCACNNSPVPTLPSKLVGSCNYTNPFARQVECRDYLGDGWTEEAATSDCKDQPTSTFKLSEGCDTSKRLGFCILGATDKYTRITLPGTSADKCGSAERGCEFFGGGLFDPAPVCGGAVTPGGGTGLPTFQQPVQTCVEPKPGEPAGLSANGQVCTWETISGATEPGRHFEDYASCNRVRTQRPYYAAAPASNEVAGDTRMNDPSYVAELEWVKSQVNAAACVCCHKSIAPEGTSNWYVDAPGNFITTFHNRGLAMGAGWIDSVGFGAYPPEQNNGFRRPMPSQPRGSIFPTTDSERMVRFFEAELALRGLKREDFASEPYGGGPLDEQRFYVPTACTQGEGVAADGTLTWRLGGARYIYILDANATPPTVPPNLDLPQGTFWKIEVPYFGTPVQSGTVKYGVVPEGFAQKFPAEGTAPSPLVSGKQYFIYVLADVVIPNTRCLFTAP